MTTKTKSASSKVTKRDTYLELVTAFPLRSIRNKRELTQAQRVLDGLLQREPVDAGESMYLDALSDLVEHYEEHNVKLLAAADADILRHLMESNELTQTKLASECGIAKTVISELLSGTRKLNRQQIDALAKRFSVSKDTFCSLQ